MSRNHRGEQHDGGQCRVFNGVGYSTGSRMCRAGRVEYVRLLDGEGVSFAEAAGMVGVSKRTGKVCRNGGTRATGGNEQPSVDRHASTVDTPKTIHPRYLSQDGRIAIGPAQPRGRHPRHRRTA